MLAKKIVKKSKKSKAGLLNKLARLLHLTHHHLAHRPHLHLHSKFSWYRQWHTWKWHPHVHKSVLAAYVLAITTFTFLSLNPTYAASNWVQNDWSGGVGSSTLNQYAAEQNINIGTINQISILETSAWSGDYTNWAKRQAIIITNTEAALANYQVKINISYASEMQPDFDDIRFTTASGAPLDYWLESKTDSSEAVVWVEVDSLAANADTTIHMYYGEATAASSSSGTNTFLFFDDFEESTIDTSLWDIVQPTFFSIQNGELKIGEGGNAWNNGLSAKTAFARANLAFEYDYRWVSANSSYDAMMMGWKDNNAWPSNSYTGLVYGYYNQGNSTCITNCPILVYEDGSSRSGVGGEFTSGQQYSLRMRTKAGGGAFYEQSTDQANWNLVYNSSYSTEANLHPAFTVHSGVHMVDNTRVRQWSVTEPTFSLGEVENKYATGTLTSNVFDASYPADWGALTYVASGDGTVSVKARSDINSDMSSASDWASCTTTPSGATLSANACVTNEHQYLQYQIILEPSGATTPVFEEITISYSPSDLIAPTENASSINMMESSSGSAITSDQWTNTQNPYFSWTAGADNAGGSGLKGYCLYLGHDNTADLSTTKGILGTSPLDAEGACQFAVNSESLDLSVSSYLSSSLSTSDAPYYLLVQAIDVANNRYAGSPAQFQFRFDNTEPVNPSFVSAPSNFVSDKDVTLTWPTSGGDAPMDSNSGLAGLQYRVGSSGTWYGDAHNGNQDNSDLLSNDGTYVTVDPIDYEALQEGNNILYFRTWDVAGNVSTAYVTTVLKLNTTSPSEPRNLEASPASNTTNSFAFSWVAPASFVGQASTLEYCYVVNSLPTASNCTYTNAGVTSLAAGAYATQPGENTMYIVARDEAGNINYATYGYVTFTANTAAPGLVQNVDIADISVKSTGNWKLALTWEEPEQTGAGVASYRIYRSSNNQSFTQVASTSGTSYVDGGLTQTTYQYYVRACDSANNCGAASSVVDDYPTGKFTEPATLLVAPSAGNLSTRKATIAWVTDRISDSKVAIGTESGVYNSDEIANSNQTVNHEVNLSNLSPGTTYYYQVKWTDGDGNTGTSAEKSFTTLPAPTVKGVVVERVSLSSARIKFTSKDAVQMKLYYGETENYGGVQTINTSQTESTYTTELADLKDGQAYFFKINPIDEDGNEYDGTVLGFETPPRPVISNLRFQPIDGEPTSTQMVTWQTNVPATSFLSYQRASEASQELSDSTLKTEHELIIKGLVDDSEYTLVAESRDKGGNLALSDTQNFRTALDTRPPQVSDITVETTLRGSGSEARGQIIVSWKTDEPATSQVLYGQGSGSDNYENRSAEDTKLVTEHVVIISDLSTSQVYHVLPVSFDKGRNEGKGIDTGAIIDRAEDGVLDIIINTFRGIFAL